MVPGDLQDPGGGEVCCLSVPGLLKLCDVLRCAVEDNLRVDIRHVHLMIFLKDGGEENYKALSFISFKFKYYYYVIICNKNTTV